MLGKDDVNSTIEQLPEEDRLLVRHMESKETWGDDEAFAQPIGEIARFLISKKGTSWIRNQSDQAMPLLIELAGRVRATRGITLISNILELDEELEGYLLQESLADENNQDAWYAIRERLEYLARAQALARVLNRSSRSRLLRALSYVEEEIEKRDWTQTVSSSITLPPMTTHGPESKSPSGSLPRPLGLIDLDSAVMAPSEPQEEEEQDQ